jgi:trimethylamine--corrinoid protein Co-methyltransferase
MVNRVPELSKEEIHTIHDASMEVLRDVGAAFHDPEAVDIFKKHGFKVDGKTVFFEEDQVMKAIDTVPSKFSVRARNPEKHASIGENDFVLIPGWGAPFVIDSDGEQREATLMDYENFCKLVHTSKYIDMNGFLMVMPADTALETSHLDMMLANVLLCDKAFMGSSQDRQKAADSLEMAAILWGGKEQIRNNPVIASKINPVSPLMYSAEMAGAVIEYARYGQPLQFPDLIMAGASAPVTLAGTAVVMNAEDLAGIVLTQLINPGTPCVYGGCSCALDMRTGGLALGGPEQIVLVSICAQLANFYGIPCKAGGNLTDSFFPDMQAGVESALTIFMTLAGGVHMVDQACGILASFNAMSYEKFLIDEETCGMMRRILKPVEINDETIAVDQIKQAGIGGAFIEFPETLERCRTEFFLPDISIRGNYDNWKANGKRKSSERATEALNRRLDAYEKPDIDPEIERNLLRFVNQKRK